MSEISTSNTFNSLTWQRLIHQRRTPSITAPSDMAESILATTRDALYGWTSDRLTRSQTAAGHPSFLHLFDHAYPAADQAGLHVFHASELFGRLGRAPPR